MADKNHEPSLEEQVQSLQAQLAQAQRLTALGELSSTITHEFNNILTSTINYAKMGLRHQDAPTRDKAFQKILAAGQRAAKVTKSILAVARNRGDKPEPTDLKPLIEDSLVLLEREMSKYRIYMDVDLADVPKAMVNGNQIQQVLINLLINARQAIEGGGTVRVQLRHAPAEGMIELTVRDDGCGIPTEKLPKIFDAFFSTKTGPDASGKGGSGLGLATCRNIIESHHGRIRVQSTVGKGTAFILKLPQAKKSTAPSPLPVDSPSAVTDPTVPIPPQG
ncbi:MAG: ATP-binding protein [Planctomycetales bacterium]